MVGHHSIILDPRIGHSGQPTGNSILIITPISKHCRPAIHPYFVGGSDGSICDITGAVLSNIDCFTLVWLRFPNYEISIGLRHIRKTLAAGGVDVAIGCSGLRPIVDLRGTTDALSRELQVTEVAIVDELAGAAELVMGKAAGVPVAVIRGVDREWFGEGGAVEDVVRDPSEDLFR